MAQPPAKRVATGAEEWWILCIQVAYPVPEIFVRAVTGHRWDTETKKEIESEARSRIRDCGTYVPT
jgi:hypothetical protein